MPLDGARADEQPGADLRIRQPASPFSREQVFLIVTGSEELSDQETFLLSILAQLCGTVITSQESIAAEQERLSQIEARQRAILEAALDAVISIDQDARVTYVNSAFERTFGYRAEEVIGQDLADKIVPPSLREAHRRGLARYLETGQATILDRRIELSAMRADGTLFPAEVTVTRTGLPGEAAGNQRPHRPERPDRGDRRHPGHHQPALGRNHAPALRPRPRSQDQRRFSRTSRAACAEPGHGVPANWPRITAKNWTLSRGPIPWSIVS